MSWGLWDTYMRMRAEVRAPATGRWSSVGKVFDRPHDFEFVVATPEVVARLSDGELLDALWILDHHQVVDRSLPPGSSTALSVPTFEARHFNEARVPSN